MERSCVNPSSGLRDCLKIKSDSSPYRGGETRRRKRDRGTGQHAPACKVGCQTALRAVRDGLIGGGGLRGHLLGCSLNCGTSVNTMSKVAKARKLKERLSEFLKPRAYSAIWLDFLDEPLKPVAGTVNVNTT